MDKLIIIRPVLDFMLKKCHTLYVPRRNLSTDEGMLKWKGRLSIREYTPMKPIKYGIKFYFLSDAKSGYVLDRIVYRGVTSTLRDIVFNLLGRHLQKGYHIFMDDFHNSVDLAKELYQNATHVSGTIRLVQGAATSLQNLERNPSLVRGEMAFRKKAKTVLCWQDERLVSFINTKYDLTTEEFIHRWRLKRGDRYTNEEVTMQRPKLVQQYTNCTGGIDHLIR